MRESAMMTTAKGSPLIPFVRYMRRLACPLPFQRIGSAPLGRVVRYTCGLLLPLEVGRNAAAWPARGGKARTLVLINTSLPLSACVPRLKTKYTATVREWTPKGFSPFLLPSRARCRSGNKLPVLCDNSSPSSRRFFSFDQYVVCK